MEKERKSRMNDYADKGEGVDDMIQKWYLENNKGIKIEYITELKIPILKVNYGFGFIHVKEYIEE